MPSDRDDFSKDVVRSLRERVGSRCSNPDCKKLTTGPNDRIEKSTIIGVASHITAAAPLGPRFNSEFTALERSSIRNGIWLCQNCGRLVDADPNSYPVEKLHRWKNEAEDHAEQELRGMVQAPLSAQHTPVIVCPQNLAEHHRRAVSLLRTQDMMGWQQFKRSTRTDLLAQLDSWTGLAANFTNWKEMQQHFDAAIPILAPTLINALCGIDSRIPEERSQRQLVKDLLGQEQFNRSASPINTLSENLAMIAHHVLGAAYLSLGLPGGAIDLLRQTYLHPSRRTQERLIYIAPAMGFSRAFHCDCTQTWAWLMACWEKMPWITSIFTTRQEWEASLRAYHMMASLVEFACPQETRTSPLSNYRATTPLCFMTGDHNEFVHILNVALPSSEAVTELARTCGVNEEDLRQAWPQWVEVMLSTRANYTGGMYTWNTFAGENAPPLPR
jgi:hypothetical protein